MRDICQTKCTPELLVGLAVALSRLHCDLAFPSAQSCFLSSLTWERINALPTKLHPSICSWEPKLQHLATIISHQLIPLPDLPNILFPFLIHLPTAGRELFKTQFNPMPKTFSSFELLLV